MKLTKLMVALAGGLALTFLMVGLTFAAPGTAAQPAQRAWLDPTITPTVTLTPTVTVTPTVTITPTVTVTPTATPVPTSTVPHTHPVALAISLYFRLPYTEVIALHDSGVGFGVIARAYLTAKASNGVLSPTQVLEMFQSGQGWGQIKKQYGVHPGGNGLGSIMSGKAAPLPAETPAPMLNLKPKEQPVASSPGNPATCPGNSCNAPGHNKPGKPPKK